MLNEPHRHHGRPAATSRRSFLWLTPALAAALLAGACAPRELADTTGAQRAVRKAITLARPRAPLQATYLERLESHAVVATAGEQAAPWWQLTPGRGQAAWLRAVVAAREVVTALRAQHAATKRRYDALLRSVEAEVARARAEIQEAGMGRREAAAMQRATDALSTALIFASRGDLSRACDHLETARGMTSVVHTSWLSVHARFADSRLRAVWRSWAQRTIEESHRTGNPAIVVDKLRRRLTFYSGGRAVASFGAELGANGLRRKVHAGDRATPEGVYRVTQMKEGRRTNFYKALLINYPNDDDRARYADARRDGTIPRRAGIGSLIEIHGEGGEGRDWTDGCVALTNDDMDWVYSRAHVGMTVTIVGTHEQ